MNVTQSITRVRSAVLCLGLVLGPALSGHAQASKPGAQGAKPAAAASEAPAASGVLNLNSASADELARLPGVGPSRAQAIIELRTRMKGFKSVEDIMRVRGIGRKMFRKLQPMLRLQGPTTLVEARKAPKAAQPAAR